MYITCWWIVSSLWLFHWARVHSLLVFCNLGIHLFESLDAQWLSIWAFIPFLWECYKTSIFLIWCLKLRFCGPRIVNLTRAFFRFFCLFILYFFGFCITVNNLCHLIQVLFAGWNTREWHIIIIIVWFITDLLQLCINIKVLQSCLEWRRWSGLWGSGGTLRQGRITPVHAGHTLVQVRRRAWFYWLEARCWGNWAWSEIRNVGNPVTGGVAFGRAVAVAVNVCERLISADGAFPRSGLPAVQLYTKKKMCQVSAKWWFAVCDASPFFSYFLPDSFLHLKNDEPPHCLSQLLFPSG